MKPTDRHWYANAGRKFHAESDDWIRSGLGVCGASIRRPGFTLLDDGAFRQAVAHQGRDPEASLCKRCLRLVRAAD